MEKTKLVFLDIDGTLIKDDKTISDFTKSTFKEVTENHNVKIILSSARMPKSLQKIAQMINIEPNFVSLNGAVSNVPLLKMDHVLNQTKPLDLMTVLDCFVAAESEEGISFNLYSKADWFCNEVNYWTEREINNTYVEPNRVRINDDFMSHELPIQPIFKVLIRGEAEKMDGVYQMLLDYQVDQKTSFHRQKETIIEITPKTVSKGKILQMIATHPKINVDHIYAFGDSTNDIEMIKMASHGFAMGNAHESLKSVATDVILSNNEDGVAKKLSEIFL